MLQTDVDYVISVNDRPYTIGRTGEFNSLYLWAAQARLMRAVDDLLFNCGSAERVHALYPGNNDSILVILTSEMFEMIRTFALEVRHDLPLATTEVAARVEAGMRGERDQRSGR